MNKPKKNHILLGFILAIIASGIYSCKDDPETVDSVNIKEEEIFMEEVGGKTEIRFTASGKWRAEVSVNWVILDRVEGMGTYLTTVNATVQKNELTEPRTAVITIYCGTSKGEITIEQGMKTEPVPEVLDPADIPDYDKYYKPAEFADMDMLTKKPKWSFYRHKHSEHFFVFWEEGFGEDPNADNVSTDMRVDIDDLLLKAEQFYNTNIEKLKFAEVGQGKSNLDKYKMQIYLHYTTEWMAYGSGYDDVIGALWINPGTCKPVGSTIAHEIGHSFQYQVYCDKIIQGETNDFKQGFRYGYEGSNGGNGFWEQCAQWQSFQDYPNELFGHHVSVWEANSHRHFEHEWMRYASYWLQYYWAQKHGVEAIGEIWKQSRFPEDALTTYMRLYCNDNVETLYAELYDYSTRMVTYDLDMVRNYRSSSAGNYTTRFYATGDYYQVAYASCPGTTGFNVIPLNVPETAGTIIKADFIGLTPGSSLATEDPGIMVNSEGGEAGTTSTYNNIDVEAGWRYGFVAVVNGNAQYAPMHKDKTGIVSYTVPANTEKLFFVVMGAPAQYVIHPWNDKESDDMQWPYKVKFEGTDLLGSFNIDETADPQDVTLTYDLNCTASSSDYPLGTINLAFSQQFAQAFAMKPGTIEDIIMPVGQQPTEGKIAIALLQTDGSFGYSNTANNGFWCLANGDLGTWGEGSTYVEFSGLNITYGHKPGNSVAGQKYIMKPTYIYTKNGIEYKATIVVNMQF